MTEIFDDNIDVDCFIGDDEWEIIDAEVVLTKRSTPNYVDMTITPADDTPIPATPQRRENNGGLLGKEFTLDVDTGIRVDTPGPEITRIFTGNLANMTPTGEYTFEAIANDATQEPFISDDSSNGRDIQNTYITIGRPAVFGQWGGPRPVAEQSPTRNILVSEVVEKVCNTLDIPEEDRNINLDKDGNDIGETYYGESVTEGFDIEVQFESWQVNVDEALTAAEEKSRSHWWFDRYGTFNFGPLVPNEDTTAYELRFITDSSAGMTTPPYRSVKVIGDGVVSEEGWTRSALVSEAKYSTGGNVYIDEDDAELADPVFTYRNMEISTAYEADHVRDKLIDKLKDQRATGTVTLVGFPELYPNDSIVMPDTTDQPMGGQRYGVNTVTHRLNNDDGFITKVDVEGLGFAQETLYEGEGDIEAVEEDLEEQRERLESYRLRPEA